MRFQKSNPSQKYEIKLDSLLLATSVLCLTLLMLVGCAHDPQSALSKSKTPIKIGAEAQEQSWDTMEIDAGLWLHSVKIDEEVSKNGGWTWRSPPLISEQDIRLSDVCLEAVGAKSIEDVGYPFPGNPQDQYLIRYVGELENLNASQATSQALLECGFKRQDRAFTPERETGPWRIQIIELDPRAFAGAMKVALAGGRIQGTETLSEIAEQEQALVAVNASFFVRREQNGVPGDVTGLSVIDGALVSDGYADRSAFTLSYAPLVDAKIEKLNAQVKLKWQNGLVMPVDGLNRRPGVNRNCGNFGDHPDSVLRHDETCMDDGEIVLFTERAGFFPNLSDKYAVWISPEGTLNEDLPPLEDLSGHIAVATGDRIDELRTQSSRQNRVSVLTELDNRSDIAYAVNGAPTLLLEGREVDYSDKEGWPIDETTTTERENSIHEWLNLRNPRTAVGVTGEGRILLVVVDGRQREFSVGLSIPELRVLMKSLGARDALNLDGGGSTSIVVNGQILNSPSDKFGPRNIADAIIVTAGP